MLGYTIKAHLVDLEKEEVAIHPLTIRSHPSNTVQELEAQIAEVSTPFVLIVMDDLSIC